MCLLPMHKQNPLQREPSQCHPLGPLLGQSSVQKNVCYDQEAKRGKENVDPRTTKQSYHVQWTIEDYNRTRRNRSPRRSSS